VKIVEGTGLSMPDTGDPAAYPAPALPALHRRCWQAELNLRSPKVTLQMDTLRGKSPESVRKEVLAQLLTDSIVYSRKRVIPIAIAIRDDPLPALLSLQPGKPLHDFKAAGVLLTF
jgi:hypothetical protein